MNHAKKNNAASEFNIDSKIKSLVDILNSVPDISTISSCQGHYSINDSQRNKFATVSFESNNQKAVVELSRFILIENVPYWSDVLVDIHQEYYVMPNEDVLRNHYKIYLRPFDEDLSAAMKRELTDLAINRTINAVGKYLDNNVNTHSLKKTKKQ